MTDAELLQRLDLVADIRGAALFATEAAEAAALIRRLQNQLRIAVDLADDLRGYTRDWDWKYGAEWDELRLQLPGGVDAVVAEENLRLMHGDQKEPR